MRCEPLSAPLAADDPDAMEQRTRWQFGRKRPGGLTAQFSGHRGRRFIGFARDSIQSRPMPACRSREIFLYMLNGKRAHENGGAGDGTRRLGAARRCHGMNASTFRRPRSPAATLADMHSAITGRRWAAPTKGPHCTGGAPNQDVMELPSLTANSAACGGKMRARNCLARAAQKVPGFGPPRLQNLRFPRAHFPQQDEQTARRSGGEIPCGMKCPSGLIPINESRKKNLNPNVRFPFSASTYYTMGISAFDLFHRPIFAVAPHRRLDGPTSWSSTKHNRIIRPDGTIIFGPMGKKVVPLDQSGKLVGNGRSRPCPI